VKGRVILIAGALVVGPGVQSPAHAAGASGVTGRAVSSICGVAPAGGQTCPDRPVRATIQVVRLPSHRRVATVRTDASGRFRVALAPGAYELRPSTTASFVYARPVDTEVRPHRFTRLTLRFYPRHPPPAAALVG
jgi:hypothetical protein